LLWWSPACNGHSLTTVTYRMVTLFLWVLLHVSTLQMSITQ
jgi:hypothetical protein